MGMRDFYYDLIGKLQDVTRYSGEYALIGVLGHDMPMCFRSSLDSDCERIELLMKTDIGAVVCYSKLTKFENMTPIEHIMTLGELTAHVEYAIEKNRNNKPTEQPRPQVIKRGTITIINYGELHIHG
jgi:hypothetical protein